MLVTTGLGVAGTGVGAIVRAGMLKTMGFGVERAGVGAIVGAGVLTAMGFGVVGGGVTGTVGWDETVTVTICPFSQWAPTSQAKVRVPTSAEVSV